MSNSGRALSAGRVELVTGAVYSDPAPRALASPPRIYYYTPPRAHSQNAESDERDSDSLMTRHVHTALQHRTRVLLLSIGSRDGPRHGRDVATPALAAAAKVANSASAANGAQ